jgi:hypothetical protein
MSAECVCMGQPSIYMLTTEPVLIRSDLLLGESQSFDHQGVVVNKRSRTLQEHRVVRRHSYRANAEGRVRRIHRQLAL